MKTLSYFRLRGLALVTVVLISAIIWSGCTRGKDSPPTPPSRGTEQSTPQSQPIQNLQMQSLPDLMISAIEVYPAEPQAGQNFALNVYVKNAGQTPSGEYDLALFIKDVSRGSTYPIGTFRKERMQPGENIVAYSSTDRLVNYPGNYQVHVEIKAFLYKDGNDQNNTAIWAFVVK